MRDITIGDTIYLKFTTRAFATGIPTVLAGTPVISAYVGSNLTQITAGVSLTISLDGVVGLNLATIVATTGNGFANATDVSIVITTGTVDSVSVIGEVIGETKKILGLLAQGKCSPSFVKIHLAVFSVHW